MPIITAEITGNYTPNGGVPKTIRKVSKFYRQILAAWCKKYCLSTQISAGSKLTIPADMSKYEVNKFFKYIPETIRKQEIENTILKIIKSNTTYQSHFMLSCMELSFPTTSQVLQITIIIFMDLR